MSVETFEGSEVVDPVVVSNVFWAGLKGKILSVIIGQILATVVFGILASLAANQISKLGDYVATNVFQEEKIEEVAGSIKSRV